MRNRSLQFAPTSTSARLELPQHMYHCMRLSALTVTLNIHPITAFTGRSSNKPMYYPGKAARTIRNNNYESSKILLPSIR